MPLDANALITLAEAKTFLNILGTGQNSVIESIINTASDLWERETSRELKERTYSNLRLRGQLSPNLYPRSRGGRAPGTPINTAQTVTVTFEGEAQTVWRTEVDGDPALKDVIVDPAGQEFFYRAGGWVPTASNPFPVLLTYTGGFATVPDDLKRAVLYTVHKLFQDEQKKVMDVTTVSLPSGSITLLDRTLPNFALRVLDKYRWTVMA